MMAHPSQLAMDGTPPLAQKRLQQAPAPRQGYEGGRGNNSKKKC